MFKNGVKHFCLLSMKIITNVSNPCAIYSAKHLPYLQPCPGYTPPLRSVSPRVVCEAALPDGHISTLYKRGANHNVSVLKSGLLKQEKKSLSQKLTVLGRS